MVLHEITDRMMTSVRPLDDSLALVFADGCTAIVPLADIPEINDRAHLAAYELPNPYQVVLTSTEGQAVELPWDFIRHYGDSSYQPRVEETATQGKLTLSARIRHLRESAGLTQEALASAAHIGRVTLVRIESGEQSPRYETLAALAAGLGKPVRELLAEA